MRRNVQPLCQNTSVIACLIQHIDEIRVFEDVGNLRGTKQVFDILGDAGGQAAPFTESLPDFYGVGGCLLLLQKQMELVNLVSGGQAVHRVSCKSADRLCDDKVYLSGKGILNHLIKAFSSFGVCS